LCFWKERASECFGVIRGQQFKKSQFHVFSYIHMYSTGDYINRQSCASRK
jgi:hypothetical protein